MCLPQGKNRLGCSWTRVGFRDSFPPSPCISLSLSLSQDFCLPFFSRTPPFSRKYTRAPETGVCRMFPRGCWLVPNTMFPPFGPMCAQKNSARQEVVVLNYIARALSLNNINSNDTVFRALVGRVHVVYAKVHALPPVPDMCASTFTPQTHSSTELALRTTQIIQRKRLHMHHATSRSLCCSRCKCWPNLGLAYLSESTC